MLSINRSVGRRIAYYRKQKGLRQYELAAMTGLYDNTISNIETGRTTPLVPTLACIAAALGVPLEELLGHEGRES
ncbi:MAG: helix-turn-helix domain-containing protein [Desulfitobacteriaceae bacterium]